MSSLGRSLWHFVRCYLGWDEPQTQTTPNEQEALFRHAAGKKRLVEIGVFEGRNTRRLAEAMSPGGELFAIDPFLGGRVGICWGKWIARRELALIQKSRRVRFVEQFSYEAVRSLPGNFDFVFIDGDHSLKGIERDWADWSPRIEPHGCMLLHDSIPPAHNPGVAQLGSCKFFAAEIQRDQRFEIIEQIDSLSVLRRRDD
jgi:predicted O-methyltransferase YrrM